MCFGASLSVIVYSWARVPPRQTAVSQEDSLRLCVVVTELLPGAVQQHLLALLVNQGVARFLSARVRQTEVGPGRTAQSHSLTCCRQGNEQYPIYGSVRVS